jgi:hypothetical protein
MDFLNRTGYSKLNSQFSNESEQSKADAKFIKDKALNALEWCNSTMTIYFKDVLYKEIERHTEKVIKCDNLSELKYLQGKIDSNKAIINRIDSLAVTARKNT